MTDDIAGRLTYLVAGAAWALDVGLKPMLAPAGLSVEQWRILAILDAIGGLTMSNLARRAFVEAGTLTKMIDRLVTEALVFRGPDPQDRRRVLVYLSEKGKALVESLHATIIARESALKVQLGNEVWHQLRDALLTIMNCEASSSSSPERNIGTPSNQRTHFGDLASDMARA